MKRMIRLRSLGIHALSFVVLSVPAFALAQSGRLDNPLGGVNSLTSFLAAVLNAIVVIVFPIIVLFMVFIGFKFIAAQGNAEEIKKVRSLFFWAVVGALLVLGAKVLSLAICETVKGLGSNIQCG